MGTSSKKTAEFTVTAATTEDKAFPELSSCVSMRVSWTGGTPALTFKQVEGGTDFPLEAPEANGSLYDLAGAYSVNFGATGSDVTYAVSFI